MLPSTKPKHARLEYSRQYRAANRDRLRELNKKWREANPNKAKDSSLRHNFNITLEQYNQLFAQQDGKCAICQKHQIEFKKALSVDHSVDTNEIRGLLCTNCNLGIGNLLESVESLERAIDYLTKTAYTGLKITKGNQ